VAEAPRSQAPHELRGLFQNSHLDALMVRAQQVHRAHCIGDMTDDDSQPTPPCMW